MKSLLRIFESKIITLLIGIDVALACVTGAVAVQRTHRVDTVAVTSNKTSQVLSATDEHNVASNTKAVSKVETTSPSKPVTTPKPTTSAPSSSPAASAPAQAAPAPASTPTVTWPTAATTGVPAGTMLSASGSLVITSGGVMIDAKDVNGTIVVKANNVTIKRTRVHSTTGGALISVASSVTGTIVQDVEVDGGGASYAGFSGPVTVLRANIHGVENGYVGSSFVGSPTLYISDSYIHDLANSSSGSPHYNGIALNGGVPNMTITHNYILAPAQTSAVNINNGSGSVKNVTVSNNYLGGGTYSLYVDGSLSGSTVSGVSVTGNYFGGHSTGYDLIRAVTLAASSGNVDATSGNAITL